MDNPVHYTRCKRCGSYMPSEWYHCGRCGYSHLKRKSGKKWVAGVLLIALLASAYFYRDMLMALLSDAPYQNMSDNQGKPGVTSAAPIAVKTDDRPLINASAAAAEQPAPVVAVTEEDVSDSIHSALSKMEKSVWLPDTPKDFDSEAVFEIIRKVVLSDPKILYYEGCTYRSDGLLTFKYSKSQEIMRAAARELDEKAQSVVEKIITPDMSDFERETAIHDYLVQNCRYDEENLNKGTIPPDSHNAYGALVTGTAVCEGYAKAAKLLLDMAGVENQVMIGTSKGESHAWNLVRIQGSYYHLDVTWDDPIMANGGETLQYTYFNLNDREMSKDHQWDKSAYPAATDTQYNWFAYHGLVVNSPEELVKSLVQAVRDGNSRPMFKLGGYTSGDYKVEALIQEAARQLKARSISYSVNEDFGVVEVWFR